VEATLTELRRETTKVVRPAMHGGEEITITEHGQAMFKIVPVRPPLDRQQALRDLMAIGPVDFLPRK
jgi:prevent-host-death family protein